MVIWEVMARPRSFGGLGFTHTRLMNRCLLLRWIVKLERGDDVHVFLGKSISKKKGFSVSILGVVLNFGGGCMKQKTHA
jgi:hypothetical protein